MSTINTAPLSGMRDFLPQDVLRRRYVVGIIESVYQRYASLMKLDQRVAVAGPAHSGNGNGRAPEMATRR